MTEIGYGTMFPLETYIAIVATLLHFCEGKLHVLKFLDARAYNLSFQSDSLFFNYLLKLLIS
jgi:hypothetical protein